MTRRLRFVIFSGSIVSDFGNPLATTVRALCQALIELGHDVVHCEERRNRYLVDLLTQRGPEPLRQFNRQFPLLTYRQFDVMGGSARRVWFSREVSTADVVVGFEGSEPGVLEEIRELESRRTLSYFPGKAQTPAPILAAWFDPAVLPRDSAQPRQGVLTVGYDHVVTGTEVGRRLSAGLLLEPGWQPVTELELPQIYANVERVRFAEEDVSEAGIARALLAPASGASAEIIDRDGTIIRTIDRLDAANDARLRAELVTAHAIDSFDQRS